MGLLDPSLVVQSRERALYLPQTPSACTASVSSLETSTHAWSWSLTLRSLTEVSFGHETLSFMTENGWIRSLRRKSTEMVKIEFCGPKRVRDRDMVIFQFRIFSLKTDT